MRRNVLVCALCALVLGGVAVLGTTLLHRPSATNAASLRPAAAPGSTTARPVTVAVPHRTTAAPRRHAVRRPAPVRRAAAAATYLASPRPAPAPAAARPVAPAQAPAAVPAAPRVHSTKKGAGAWTFDGIDKALADSGVSWFYDWSSDRGGMSTPGVEFVPMIWGAKSVTAGTLAQAKSEGHTLLGFNEPDFASQSNMSVGQALSLWPQLMATGMRLGSPAVATGAANPGGWLDQFLAGAAARHYRVDFLTLHWYGGDFGPDAVNQLRSYVQATWSRYHKPIWVTEYALLSFAGGHPTYPTSAQQVAFVKSSTAMLSSLSYVERYAWFALPATSSPTTGLYAPGAVPNASGLAYRAAS